MYRRMRARLLLFVVGFTLVAATAGAQDSGPTVVKAPPEAKAFSPTLEDVPYPYPVHALPLTMYGQDVRMAYMDVAAAGTPNGRSVVLLHGMNFYGEYFSNVIDALRNEGYRVVVVDQVGFGRSSKPIMPYTLSDMAFNTAKLLDSLSIPRANIVGHSMGGMVAARFAMLYPGKTEKLVLYNQIGMTDARLQRPPTPLDEAYKQVLGQSYDAVYRGLARYFPNGVPKVAEKYIARQYGWTLSGNWPTAAMVRALVQQMVYEDPVVYDWAHIKAKTLEIGGEKDGATPDWPEHAKHVAQTIPDCTLVLLPNIGHVPHFEAPEKFFPELLKFLKP